MLTTLKVYKAIQAPKYRPIQFVRASDSNSKWNSSPIRISHKFLEVGVGEVFIKYREEAEDTFVKVGQEAYIKVEVKEKFINVGLDEDQLYAI